MCSSYIFAVYFKQKKYEEIFSCSSFRNGIICYVGKQSLCFCTMRFNHLFRRRQFWLGGGHRSLSVSELRACVVFFGDNVYVVVTVLQNLGEVELSITNTSTGWYIDGEFNAVPGSYPIPISGSPGFYTISFILPDGRSCLGAFEL